MGTSLAGNSYADGPMRPEPAGIQYGAETLDGKRALITGGTRGMGAAIAELFTAQKAHVIVTARHQDGTAPARLIRADLTSPEGADFVAEQAIEILGGLDVVVHCVGASFAKPGGALALTDDDWMQALDTNLLSAVRLTGPSSRAWSNNAQAPSCTSRRCNGSAPTSRRQLTDPPKQP